VYGNRAAVLLDGDRLALGGIQHPAEAVLGILGADGLHLSSPRAKWLLWLL
jgi:hypothetical protein